MNQSLQHILNLAAQADALSAEQKKAIEDWVKEVDKLITVTEFKLDRTEKVKRTTAILLEETIAELEQKRKAVEAQNRELEIEAALEKVRSRSLAMHKSEEIKDVVVTVMNNINELNIQMNGGVSLATFVPGSNDLIHWYVNPEHVDGVIKMHLPQFDSLLFKDFIEARSAGKEILPVVYSFEEKNKYFEYTFAHSDFKIIPEKLKQWILDQPCFGYSVAIQKHSAIFFNDYTGKLFSEQENDVLVRFGRVFDQAYIRFLDLQKAEAQAREAKVEAALERTRTQSMLMQRSKELDDALRVFHEQVLLLGINSEFSYLWLPDEDKDRHIFWAAWAEKFSSIQPGMKSTAVLKSKAVNYALDRNDPATALCLTDWKSNVPIHSYHLLPAEVENYFASWRELLEGVENLKPENFRDGLYYVEAYMKYGCFGVMLRNDLTEEEKRILYRFAIEFERTYTRFLDLQKAEAQAREQQIEAALERVRARAMAMHKTNELLESGELLFKELTALGIASMNVSYAFVDKEEKFGSYYSVNPVDGRIPPFPFIFPHTETEVMRSLLSGWKRQEPFEVIELDEQATLQHQTYIGEHILQEIKKHKVDIPFTVEEFLAISPKTAAIYSFNFRQGYLFVIGEERLTTEQEQMVLRFTKVFELAYRRFLDLSQAEEQAREASIEAALEKVRSRTIAMQKSEDLSKTASEMFKQIQALGMHPWACGFNIFDKDEKAVTQWMSLADGGISPPFRTPLTEDPFFISIYDARQRGDELLVMESSGAELANTYRYMFRLPGSGEIFGDLENSGFEMPKFQITHCAYFSQGYLVFITYEQVKESWDIFKRFAKVFEQTYTRFLDLQKAEAQAKEAQIEAALEKVRSRTLAMQKSDELAETASVLFKQLILLGIAPNRLYINVIKDEKGGAEFWITDEDGSKISTAYTADMNANPSFRKMFEGWKKQKKSLILDMQGKELKEYFQHLSNLNVPFKGGLTQKRRLQYIAYFSKGFIGMASPDEQPEETIQLLERFASVFNLTFTRFNDLKLAEAHAIQAEKDLEEIKAAKKKAEDALSELQVTQRQLIQSEKMASLGELTAGIAHEIQNPLNFVNNFSDVNAELIDEVNQEIVKGNFSGAKAILKDIRENEQKISHHGKRADAIVKGMLQHSRTSSGQKEPTDINALCDEYLRLAYHGLRARDKGFNAKFETHFDKNISRINVVPQDIGRVILNLINNASYAVAEKKKNVSDGYEPIVAVSTNKSADKIEIKVKDNGTGIPEKVLDKIFQPFFSTKPTGQGTGLGLSLAYDIVTKGHGGELKVETKEGDGTVFTVQIPMI